MTSCETKIYNESDKNKPYWQKTILSDNISMFKSFLNYMCEKITIIFD